MAKKQRKFPVQKHTGTMAMISLFCAAAGVYAADEPLSDGWSFNAETATIEHNGDAVMPRLTPIQKGNKLGDSTIESVSNVKVSGSAKMLENGVVFDGGEAKTGTLTMEEGAVLDSDRATATGAAFKNVTTVKFEDGVKGKIDAAGATISAENHLSATAVSGGEIESITAKEISAKSAEGNATAMEASVIDSVNVDKVVGDVNVGQAKDVNIGELDGNLKADILGDASSKDSKVSVSVSEGGSVSVKNIASEASIRGISSDDEKSGAFAEVRDADKKLTLGGKLNSIVGNANEGIVIDNVKGNVYLNNVSSSLGESAIDVKGTLDGDLISFGNVKGDVNAETINGNTGIRSLDGDFTAKTLGKSDLAEGEAPSRTDIGIKADLNAEHVVSIENINGEATISKVSSDGAMRIKNIGNVAGNLTVNDYANIDSIDNVEGTLTLNGSDDSAKASIRRANTLDANADGIVNVEEANTVFANKGESLSLKGQTVEAKSESSRTTIKSLDEGGSVFVNDVKLDGSIDGFKGNLTAKSTGDVSIENGLTGNLNIAKVNGNFVSDEKAISGDVSLGSVYNVDIKGGIAANGETAQGNLKIDNAFGNIDVKKGVAGNVEIGSAGSVIVKDGIGGNMSVEQSYGIVDVDTVGGDMTIGANSSIIRADKVEGTATINGDGSFGIKEAGNLALGTDSGSLTISDNGAVVADSNLNSMVDQNGNSISTKIAEGGTITVGTLDKATTIDGFTGNLNATNTADISVGDKDLTGNLNVDSVNGNLTSTEDGKISGDVSLGSVYNVDIKGGIAANGETAQGNLKIDNAFGNIDVKKGVAGNVEIGSAGSVIVKDGIGGNMSVEQSYGIVDVDTVGGDMTIGANSSIIRADKVEGTATINGDGSFGIKEAGNLALGTDSGSLTISDNGAVVADSNLNSMVDQNGNAISTKIAEGGTITVGTLDKATTIDGFTGNLNATNTADISVGDKDLTGDLNVGNIDGKLSSTAGAKIRGDITVAGNVKEIALDSDVDGSLSAGSTSGAASVKNITGDMSIGTAGGDVSASEVGGTLAVDNVNGKTVSADKAGSVEVGGTGNVKVDNAENLVVNGNAGLSTDGNLVSTTGDIKVSGKTDDSKGMSVSKKLRVSNVSAVSDIKDFKGDVEIDSASAKVSVNGEKTNLTIGLNGSDDTTEILDVEKAGTVKITGGTGKATINSASIDTTELGAITTKIDGQKLIQTIDGSLNIEATIDKSASLGTTLDADVNNFNGELSIANAKSSVADRDVLTVSKGAKSDITVGNAEGNVKVNGDIKKIDVSFADNAAPDKSYELTVDGKATTARINNGDAYIKSVEDLTAFDKAAEEVKLDIGADNKVSIARKVSDEKTQVVEATVSTRNGKLTVNNLDTFDQKDAKFNGDISVKGSAKDFTIGDVNNLEFANGVNGSLKVNGNVSSINAENQTINGDLTVGQNKGDGEIKVGKIIGKMKLANSRGSVTVGEVVGNVDVKLNREGAELNIGKAADVTLSGDRSNVGESAGTAYITEADSLKFGSKFNGDAKFGTILGDVDAQGNTINNLEIGTAEGKVSLADVEGKLTIGNAKGGAENSVSVNNVNELDVRLSNDTNLTVNGTSSKARVNGGCDATFAGYAENINIDDHLDGTLTIENGVGNLFATNVKNIKLDRVDGIAKFLGDGAITILNNDGTVSRFENGLDALQGTGAITLENEVVIAADKKFEADNRDVVAEKQITFEGVNAGSDGVVLSAKSLSGSKAKSTIDALYKDAYGIGAEGKDSLTKYTLVGDHGDIAGKVAADISALDNSLNDANLEGGYYNSEGNKVVFKVSKNSFFENNVASENEKTFARIIDSAEFTGNDASDANAVAMKHNYFDMLQNGALSAALPQAVSRASRMNMDLGNIIHLDTLNRTAYTRDLLDTISRLKADGKLLGRKRDILSGTSSVTVRNINRFANYGGDSNAAGSNDYIYGGLANVEYVFDEDFFAGIGVGGFQAKSSGKNGSGKAETQSVAVNAYADYRFFDNFDWYLGATYAYGMNSADRQRGVELATSDWNSSLIGVFTGVRYTWRPLEDQSFAVKPMVGVNANFLLNPSFDEDSGAFDRLSVDSSNSTSVKSVVGVEVSKSFEFGLSVAARMLYTHEFADNSFDVNATLSDATRTYGSFIYRGYEMNRDSGVFGIGLGYDINKSWRAYVDYAAEVSDDVYHNLSAGIQFKF